MRRDQTAHERLIPLLVEIVGSRSYLELGTHLNETISKVKCERRYGVDINAVPCEGTEMFSMTTLEFIQTKAEWIAPFDFAFIDASHSLPDVRADFMGILPFVAPEGMIALHDTQPQTVADATPGFCGDAWKFAYGVWITGMECLTLNYHPGLTLIRKRESWEGPVP